MPSTILIVAAIIISSLVTEYSVVDPIHQTKKATKKGATRLAEDLQKQVNPNRDPVEEQKKTKKKKKKDDGAPTNESVHA